jgi:hypothetical protein
MGEEKLHHGGKIEQDCGIDRRTVRERAIDALVSIRIGRECAPTVLDALSSAGLKIVDCERLTGETTGYAAAERRRMAEAERVRDCARKGLWLLAETAGGVYLEFWRDGAAIVSLEPRPSLSIEQLEAVWKQLKRLNLIPRDIGSLLGASGFSRETQD